MSVLLKKLGELVGIQPESSYIYVINKGYEKYKF